MWGPSEEECRFMGRVVKVGLFFAVIGMIALVVGGIGGACWACNHLTVTVN